MHVSGGDTFEDIGLGYVNVFFESVVKVNLEAVASKTLPMEVCTHIVWGFKVVGVYSDGGEGVLVVVYSETSNCCNSCGHL